MPYSEFNINNNISENNISFNDHLLSKEVDIIDYCRKLVLLKLNELIIKYGQDFKNEQWILEPFADMVISFSVMHVGFCRFNQFSFQKFIFIYINFFFFY